MTHIKLTHDSTTYLVNGIGVAVAGNVNLFNKPLANGTDIAEIQTQSYNNPNYSISGIHFTGVAGSLTYAALLSMYKNKYDGSNPIYLEVQYGDSDNLVGADGTTTSIPVVVSSFTFPISTSDSRKGYMPVASLNLTETK